MAHLKKSNTPSSHWYKADGTPCHQLPRAKGSGLRATTLRDARKLQLFPSVTSILGIFSKPQLDRWKLQQVALASLRLERSAEESDDYYVDRLIDEAFQQVEQAADLGSRIHDAIEKHYEGVEVPQDLQAYTSPVFAWQAQKQIQFIEREKVLVNTDYGFAGTMDIACRYGQDGIGVIDFKTKKTKPGVEVKPFDGQAMQIAAYAATYWGEAKLPQVYGANVYISTTEPGRLEVCTYTPEQLVAEWEVYKLACAIWRHSKKYDPRPAAGGQRSVVATAPGGQRSVVATASGGMTSASSASVAPPLPPHLEGNAPSLPPQGRDDLHVVRTWRATLRRCHRMGGMTSASSASLAPSSPALAPLVWSSPRTRSARLVNPFAPPSGL
jgi:hypothetical protein